MAIIKYTASADNTITNAFDESMQTVLRATGSNMGKADVLEVFSIYGQNSGSSGPSSELSRILIKFDTTAIKADRTATSLPASGSVKFFLKLYNTPHATTTPEDFKLTVARLTADWEEGFGLDMDNYTDKTYDGIGSNWVNAKKLTSASATFTGQASGGGGGLDNDTGSTLKIVNTDQTSVTFTTAGGTLLENGNATTIGTSNLNNAAQVTQALHVAFSAAIAAKTLKMTISPTTYTDETVLTLTQLDGGTAGNTTVTNGTDDVIIQGGSAGANGTFTNGAGQWTAAGGDFTTSTSNDFVDVNFEKGTEDMEVDITALVEEWIKDSAPPANYGMIIKMSSSLEAYYNGNGTSTATALDNTSGAKRSFFTKKFYARDTEYYFKKPCIEARWDNSRRDDRGNIFLSSSLAPANDNLNTIYMYNYVRGKLADIAGSNSAVPNMKLYYSSRSTPEGTPRTFIHGGSSVAAATATRVSTGSYSISFAINKDQFPDGYPYLVDVWNYNNVEVHTGSAMLPKSFNFSEANPNSQYVIAVSNMRKHYNKDETARFRVSIRHKDWSPTIHTIASNNVELATVPSASYEIFRVVDEEIVVPFGTGSTAHTVMSYDSSGSYFDFDMSNLEDGYSYGIRFSIYEDSVGSYREHPSAFKFRVRKDEY